MSSRPDILARWARSTLLGPLITVWVMITLALLVDSLEELVDFVGAAGPFTDEWWLAMLFGSFWAGALAALLVAVDVTLLRMRFRALPGGFRGWLGAILAPIAVGLWQQVLPGPGSIPAAVGMAIASMALAALSVRVLFGTRP